MRTEFSPNATAQIEEIKAFLAQTSAQLAEATADRLTRRAWQLAEFPNSGAHYQRLRDLGVRYIVEGSYRLYYVVGSDRVLVLGIRHTSRRPL